MTRSLQILQLRRLDGGSAFAAGLAGAAVSAGVASRYAMNSVYAALPEGCAQQFVGGLTYYGCRGTWFASAYGANGVYYRVVPAP